MVRVPVREQDPKVRATNFEEVCLGYNQEEAMEEATRCLNCKNAKCIEGCPVSINIPAFIQEVKEGNIEEAYKIIGQSSALPAICGRVCPHERQCEAHCVLTKKKCGIEIGSLEMFIADFAHNNDLKPTQPSSKLRGKVAVIGSGPAGLTVAGDLAKMDFDVTIFEAQSEPGGVLLFGIPEFRLQKVRKNKGNQLSGGERRRTEIARCLAIDPKFIMLDEPFAGVDPIAVEDIQQIVWKLKDKNIGILITDHNVQETLSITDRAYLLFEGKILFQGTPEELSENQIVREKYLSNSFVLRRKDFQL